MEGVVSVWFFILLRGHNFGALHIFVSIHQLIEESKKQSRNESFIFCQLVSWPFSTLPPAPI